MSNRYSLYDPAPQTKGKDNYKDIATDLANHNEFAGGSMSAFWTDDDQYVVVSYRTVIATYDGPTLIKIATNKWGPTTGRHINLCKENL